MVVLSKSFCHEKIISPEKFPALGIKQTSDIPQDLLKVFFSIQIYLLEVSGLIKSDQLELLLDF